MQILMLVTDGYGCLGGIAQYNRDFLAALNDCTQVETVRVWPRNIAQPIAEPIPEAVIYARQFSCGKWRYVMNALASLIAPPRYDLVICGHLHLLPLAWLAAKRRRASLALLVYGVEAWKPTAHSLNDFLARRIDWLIAISDITEDRFRAWAQPDAPGVRIPPCVDLSRFAPGPKPAALAARYGVAGKRVMMTVGRLASSERYKGVDEVIALLPALIQRFPDLCYIVVGEGDDRARLQEKARALGVEEKVVFAGRIDEADKADHYRLADLYVMPSSGEGFGIVMIEAAATGAALIGSSVDGTREALAGGALGAIVDPADTQALHNAIVDALAAPAPRRRPAAVEMFSRAAFGRHVAEWLAQTSRKA